MRHQGCDKGSHTYGQLRPPLSEDDGATERARPFGLALRLPASSVPDPEGVVTWSGSTPLIQEWVIQPHYDPSKPIGLWLSPRDIAPGEKRVSRSQNSRPLHLLLAPQIEVTYPRRRVAIV